MYKTLVLVSTAWILANLLPFVVIGEQWGMQWFLINWPLSKFVETAIGIGGLGMVVAVTVVNGLLWGLALAVLVRLVNRARNHEISGGDSGA